MPNADLPGGVGSQSLCQPCGQGWSIPCIPSCSAQLPLRNAGLPRDGLHTPREKRIPLQHSGLNPAGEVAESDKATLKIIIGFFSLTSIQTMSEAALY